MRHLWSLLSGIAALAAAAMMIVAAVSGLRWRVVAKPVAALVDNGPVGVPDGRHRAAVGPAALTP